MANNSRTGDFTPKIKKELAEEVNFICSNPGCSIQTHAPSNSRQGSRTSVGQAAHIHAAAPKGARYDGNMTLQERGAKDNGIWLCNLCARKIDVDGSEYSADLLRGWKRSAISRTQDNLGKKSFGEKETQKYVISAVADAIKNKTIPIYGGLELHSLRELDGARNALDDSFSVQTNIVDNSVVHLISAKKPSFIDVTFYKDDDGKEFSKNIKEYIRSGSGFSLHSSGVLIQGPKIIEQNTNGEFVPLTISVPGNETSFDFLFYFSNLDEEILLDRCPGVMTKGEEFATLKTKIFGGFISFTIVVSSDENPKCTLSYDVTNAVWEGHSVLHLDGYAEAKNFINNFENYEDFSVKIKSNDSGCISEIKSPLHFVQDIKKIYEGWFDYIDACRFFSRRYSVKVTYLDIDVDFSQVMLTVFYYKLIKAGDLIR